ncbi:MAG: helix-turn-helix domain-containing protein [Gammaproteobacteria bacterium]|nr:helix-turn-helix domain-containing protein [Gammaproteobacteria bacterium]MBU1723033.1 helix-turn-helix domain-containing protein [Gammaproteobacteria bacterium]MBU2003834.1 helix-turn-helix domain-containing protein [Gammaproteobacteria bacterium]
MAGKIKARPTPTQDGPMSMKLLGQYVRARRTQAGLRIDDAALLCGVAKDTLSRIETGRTTVQVSSVLQVLQQLGINLKVEPWEEETHGA